CTSLPVRRSAASKSSAMFGRLGTSSSAVSSRNGGRPRRTCSIGEACFRTPSSEPNTSPNGLTLSPGLRRPIFTRRPTPPGPPPPHPAPPNVPHAPTPPHFRPRETPPPPHPPPPPPPPARPQPQRGAARVGGFGRQQRHQGGAGRVPRQHDPVGVAAIPADV